MSTTTNHKVLIIGAGLGGLVLAQALRKLEIPFEVFERDLAEDARYQGWSLSLHWVLPHLRAALPNDLTPPIESTAVNYAMHTPSELVLYNGINGEVIRRMGEENDMIRVNRDKLRKWLSQKIVIHWGKRFTRFEQGVEGTIVAFFEDGISVQGTILVGADGVHSRVRNQLFAPNPPQLQVLPISINIATIKLNKQQLEHAFSLSNTFWISFGEKVRLMFSFKEVAEDQQSAEAYWILSWLDEDTSKFRDLDSKLSNEEHAKKLNEYTAMIQHFHPKFQKIVIETLPNNSKLQQLILRDMMPVPLPLGNITLLGDAIHPMSPFRGEGGNNAMLDACKLAGIIGDTLSTREEIPSAFKKYESEMLERGTNSVVESRKAGYEMHGAKAVDTYGNTVVTN